MPSTHAGENPIQPSLVRSFVRRFRTEILAAWRQQAREIPVAHDLPPVVLVDHIPELLDQIADVAEALASTHVEPGPFETARHHALDRIGEGFDVSAVVKELSLLRDTMLTIWQREHGGSNVGGLRALDLAIDRAIEASVARYAEARERTLAGIDQISTATLTSRSVDELLERLLSVFIESTPAIDTAAIMLVENGVLRTRAAVGLDHEVSRSFELGIGEGFSGQIAAHRTPMLLRSAYTDPLVRSDAIRERRVRALYGVPLVHGGEVIGVAHMGSVSAHEVSQDDRQFFDSLVARATVGIVHQMVRQQLAVAKEHANELAADRERTIAKLESLLAASPVGIAFVDRELRYLSINDALARLNGRPAAEHIGRTIGEMLPPYVEPLARLLRRVLATGEPALNVEVEVTGPMAGEHRWVLVNYFPVRSSSDQILGVGAVVIDISETRRAQEALRTEQARLRSIVEHAPAAIWVKDRDGRIVFANKRLAHALGGEVADVIGKRTDEVLPAEFAQPHQEHDARVILENRAVEAEEMVPSAEGPRTFLTIKFPIPGDPPLIGGIATEISERKHMEQELRVAVLSRDDLMAIVSHDLRGPLQTVELAATLLGGQLEPEHPLRRHVDVITRSCERMESLIEDLLDTAMIREGRIQLELHRERADVLVREAVELQEPLAAEKGITLIRRSDLGDASVECDRDRILQVFANLIGNALKFCQAGDTITVWGDREDDVVRLCVEDTGPGIAQEALPHLFERYWSAHAKGAKGAGLGLYIVRGIVESHGGRVWAESTPGGGAHFYFTLPLAR